MKNTLEKTREILKEYNITANKRYGQNFLIDDNVLFEITNVANIKENELVIEIGPGLGNLTEYLLESSTYCLLVEIDDRMISILNNRFSSFDNFTILNDDVMKINLGDKIQEIEEKFGVKFDKVKVVANLPYYITTPILFKLLQDENMIDQIVVMVQNEVAQRMVACTKTKDYGILSLMVKYLCEANIEIILPNNSFIPAPEVTSAVIKLNKNKRFLCKNEDILFKLIHMAFAQRRKKMINSLESNKFLGMSKDSLVDILNSLEINVNARAEELSLEDYIKIVDEIEK